MKLRTSYCTRDGLVKGWLIITDNMIFFEPHVTEVMSKLELQSYEATIDMADIVSVQKKQMHSEPG
jgi:hypothetical protein